jgi:hypothetical protein
MRRHRTIFLAAATIWLACGASKKDVESAKRSVYDADFAVVYGAALEATREVYPNLDEAPGRGLIKTAWHQVSYANNQDDLSNQQVVAANQGRAASTGQAAIGMPTRLAYKRFFVRFEVTVAGGRPWRLKVVGHAAEWEPGQELPSELHGVARPSWLEGRTEALTVAIYKRLKPHALAMTEAVVDSPEEVRRVDPSTFKAVPPGAAKRLATLKDALAARNYPALRGHLADDIVWSLGGGTGADAAMATWQADPEALDAMGKALAAGCAGDDKKVSCPAGAPASGTYQLQLEPRREQWQVTSFVRAD